MDSSNFFLKIVPVVKQIFGISDLSLFRKRWVKRIGHCIYHKKYTAIDLVGVMCKLGMKRGSVICIHASMMQFFNYIGTAEDLITEILNVIGPDGTLIMPAFPLHDKPYEEFIFDTKTDKTGAGYLAEAFRKYPGVLRSNNVHHSVCAIGKYAEYLIQDHTKGMNCWDEYSPWYKMCELDAIVFNLGMPRSYIGTFHHCVEAILYKEHPYWAQFFTFSQKYNYKDTNGNVVSYSQIEGKLVRKTREKKVTRYFTDKEWNITKLSNLEIKAFYSQSTLRKMIDLGRKGISVYRLPSTKNFNFDKLLIDNE